MGIIQVLDEHIANQIAAGEVVERPSSVVKELVENAVDARSTRIDVYIEDGGLQLIRVVDNGSGIAPEDCETAFYRHATSKIHEGRDLFRIRSLGFRGEALASIAAVSKTECYTAIEDSGLGRRIVIEGGSLLVHEEAAASKGTDFRIKDLFYNTPARLKYMKTIQTELGHISDYLYRLALAHPQISFTLKHNDKELLRTLGNGDLLQVIAAVYGTSTARSMAAVQGESMDYRIKGYVGRPELTRANRHGISFIINGRYIRNYALAAALMQSYHTLLPVHRFPLAVLHIQMDPELVDVNVHPSKLEVRFSKEAELVELITSTVRAALLGEVLIPQPGIPKKEKHAVIQEQLPLYETASDVPSVKPEASMNVRTEHRQDQPAVRPQMNLERRKEQAPDREEIRQFMTAQPSPPATESQLPQLPKLHPIGQLHGLYIVAQNEEGLYLIDQHAAHERINYELFYEKFGQPIQASQELLLPLTLEFTPAEAELLIERMQLFQHIGVYLEPFGGNTFKVTSYPYWLPKGEELEVITEMADWILTEKKTPDIAKLREKSAILCACKASIKANQSQTMIQLEKLIDRLRTARNPYTCPHGRPIIISFSTYDLEKMFKRVM